MSENTQESELTVEDILAEADDDAVPHHPRGVARGAEAGGGRADA